jgi:hypothetical protein
MPKASDSVKVACDSCGGEPRNHDILSQHKTEWHDEINEEQGGTLYQICRCRGCEAIRFREESWSTHDIDYENNLPIYSVQIYPKTTASSNRRPSDTTYLPQVITRIYAETVAALNVGAPILAGGGLRAIVETICNDQRVTGKNLQSKIDGLVSKGLLAKAQADFLHEERFLGNAALHEAKPPSKQELDDGLAIIEGLLNTIYVLPVTAGRLRAKRAKRSQAIE